MVFPILFHARARKTQSHYEENHSCHLEPQLVCGAPEGPSGGADGAHHRAQPAVAAGLLAGNPRHRSELS